MKKKLSIAIIVLAIGVGFYFLVLRDTSVEASFTKTTEEAVIEKYGEKTTLYFPGLTYVDMIDNNLVKFYIYHMPDDSYYYVKYILTEKDKEGSFIQDGKQCYRYICSYDEIEKVIDYYDLERDVFEGNIMDWKES